MSMSDETIDELETTRGRWTVWWMKLWAVGQCLTMRKQVAEIHFHDNERIRQLC